MLTPNEEYEEFWMLVKSVLQDSKVDAEEARVIFGWLREHNLEGRFDGQMKKLSEQLADGWIDRFESAQIVEATGTALKILRAARS